MLGKHLFGLYEKALDGGDPWDVRLKKTKALGFDYMEISIDETDQRLARLYRMPQQIEDLGRACVQFGVPFQTMCLSAHRRFPFGSADPAIRQTAYDIMQRAIDFAAAMGIRVIQLAGYDVYYEPSTPESVQRFYEGLSWAVKAAAQKQVMLAMETMDTPFLNSISKNLVYENLLRSPWFRTYPDMGNLSAWPDHDVDSEFATGIASIVAVHVKDTLPVTDTFPGQFRSVPLGSGCVDFPRRFRQLEQLGYTGPYMLEMWFAPDSDDTAAVAQAKIWLEEQFRAATNGGCNA